MKRRRVARSASELKMQEILRWQMMDKSIGEIAILMNMSEDAVSKMVEHPRYRAIRDEYVGGVYEQVDQRIRERKADTMLEDAAPDAAQALIALLNQKQQVVGMDGSVHEVPLSPTDTRLTATAILDRAGYGPIQRKVVKGRMELDPMLKKMFEAALRESSVEVVDGEVIESGEPDEVEEAEVGALPGGVEGGAEGGAEGEADGGSGHMGERGGDSSLLVRPPSPPDSPRGHAASLPRDR